MPRWDAEQYLKFTRQRTRPSEDLAAAIPLEHPLSILDAGCGPGNSTAVLAQHWPAAQLTGVDLSGEMLEAAAARLPQARFLQEDLSGDLSALGCYDLVFSNAALQWLEDMESAVVRLFVLVNPGGALAVQVPVCTPKPSADNRLESGDAHAAMWETANEEPFSPYTGAVNRLHSLSGETVYELLNCKAAMLDVWETCYCHELNGYEGLVEWYRGTGMRPYLEALPDEDMRHAFEKRFQQRIAAEYPLTAEGKLLFWFRRLFFVACR